MEGNGRERPNGGRGGGTKDRGRKGGRRGAGEMTQVGATRRWADGARRWVSGGEADRTPHRRAGTPKARPRDVRPMAREAFPCERRTRPFPSGIPGERLAQSHTPSPPRPRRARSPFPPPPLPPPRDPRSALSGRPRGPRTPPHPHPARSRFALSSLCATPPPPLQLDAHRSVVDACRQLRAGDDRSVRQPQQRQGQRCQQRRAGPRQAPRVAAGARRLRRGPGPARAAHRARDDARKPTEISRRFVSQRIARPNVRGRAARRGAT